MPSRPISARPRKCPICGKATVEAYRPFCSKRCADIDLGKWLSGSYTIAGREEDEGDGNEAKGTQDTREDED